MRDTLTALTGKAVRQVARLRGGGSAMPGLVVERIDSGFMARILGRLRYGVVVVSGTNGKTTTTKMIVEMLESQGLKVFTNKTGSNFSRGVVAAAVAECSLTGKLDADIAVLELDEAHAMYFINRVAPDHTLLLNVFRDQLDRFGEIDTTAAYLQRIADATSTGVLVNREDTLVTQIGDRVETSDVHRPANERREVRRFGLSPQLRHLFPGDEEHVPSKTANDVQSEAQTDEVADVVLMNIDGRRATLDVAGQLVEAELKLDGVYNVYNAAAALGLVRMVLQHHGLPSDTPALADALAEVRPAFGRGERLELDGEPLDLVLVKNPAGFRLALTEDSSSVATMIAINDQYADGRDMSWLWDVSFESLAPNGVEMVAGTRAWEMALRLEHDGVEPRRVTEELGDALKQFRAHSHGTPRRIFCTYTAMLALRERLADLTEVENVW